MFKYVDMQESLLLKLTLLIGKRTSGRPTYSTLTKHKSFFKNSTL